MTNNWKVVNDKTESGTKETLGRALLSSDVTMLLHNNTITTCPYSQELRSRLGEGKGLGRIKFN